MVKRLLLLITSVCFFIFQGCEQNRAFNEQNADEIFYIPNAFSPDGNHVNDRYTVIKKSQTPDLSHFAITIYDQESKIYHCKDVKPEGCAWNGKINGSYVSPGNYFCVIEYKLKGKEQLETIETLVKVINADNFK